MTTVAASVKLKTTVTASTNSVTVSSGSPVTVKNNAVTVGTPASGTTFLTTTKDSAGANVGTDAQDSVVSNSTIVNSNSSYSASVVAQGSLTIPDTDIQVNGAALISQPSTITKDVVVKYANGTPTGTITAGEVVVNNPIVCADVTEQINGSTIGTVASGGTNNQVVQNSAATPVGTAANPSVIGDATATVNGVSMATIPAEGTDNIQVRQETGATLVGSKQGQYWRVDNSQAQVNGVNTETIAATVTHDQQIHDSAGADVGTSANPSVITDNSISFNGSVVDSVKAQEAYLFTVELDSVQAGTYDASTNKVSVTSSGGGSLSLGLFSDAGHTTPITRVDAGSTVYLKADATGYTPDNYLFFAYNGSEMYPIISQAGNTYTWTVGNDLQTGETSIYAQAKNVGGDQEFDLLAIEAYSYYVDLFPVGFQCCSVKLERKLYAGAIMSIRRPSDNAVKAFYPDALERLTLTSEDGSGTSLATWIGSEDGFIYEWNDQTTNGNDWTQATLNDQPKIVSGGVLLVDTNGLAAPTFAITNGLDMSNFGGKSRVDTDSVITSSAPFIIYIGASNTFSFVGVSGNTSTTITSNFGTPIIYSDGVAVRERNRNDIYVASSGTSRLVTYEEGNTTNSDWNTSTFARYSGTNGFVGICQFNATFSGDQSATRVARATQLKANFQ